VLIIGGFVSTPYFTVAPAPIVVRETG